MEPATKKQRQVQCLSGNSLSYRQLEGILKTLAPADGGGGAKRKTLTRMVDRRVVVTTPLGDLWSEMNVPLANGRSLKFPYANPFVLLYHMFSTSMEFAMFLKHLVAGVVAGVVIYTDETTPGNQLRPDKSRELFTVYWSLKEFPPWFRARANGWLPFMYVKTKVVDQIVGGVSGLMKHVLRVFLTGPFNLATTGFPLKDPTGNRFNMRATLSAVLQDEKAHKEAFSLKGASGTKFCVHCKNVVRGDINAYSRDPYVKHVALAIPAEFDPHTPDSFLEMVHLLESSSAAMPAKDFGKLEQVLGLNFNPHALPFDPELQKLINPVQHLYWDHMHCGSGSGGIAQYEINGFVRALAEHGVDPCDLDAFCAPIKWPSGIEYKFPATFFQDRIVWKPHKHVKAFASEVLTALRALCFFIELVLDPCGRMTQHCRSLKLVAFVIRVLGQGNEALKCLPQLRRALEEHHALCMQLYGHEVARIPKQHFMFHVLDCIERHGVVLSCYAPERKHKEAKSKAHHCFGTQLGSAVLKRVLLDLVTALDRPTFCADTCLQQPSHAATAALFAFLRMLLPDFGEFHVSNRISTARGAMGKDDLVSISTSFCIICQFVAARLIGSPREEFFAIVRPCYMSAANTWVAHDTVEVVSCADLGEATPYLPVDLGMRVSINWT